MTDKKIVETRRLDAAGSSREVNWWATHLFIEAAVAQANCGPIPVAGTPAWSALADGDPRKLLALAAAGEHWVLRMQIGQEQRAQAAEDIWGGADWSEAARTFTRRHEIDEIRRAS
ncbi:DUF2742 domain-containing protein [Mycobacterium sp. SMC-4]|uniref:DUF2742 domain-containing protein n=1 Tax=Mycobacterium sp. SMC-4 TaxID=2857059 RepID=UPI0021B22384|nr:DUF2742 domain-containing protein [Mycobacterium sp. SMC-4]UXA17029.1 DUF2742 domain-containing protein [Mycobacterium sp. SMC-4]